MPRVHNCHLDAVAFIRAALRCNYEKALRMAQLYGYIEHLASRGGAASLNQAGYSAKTGCHRATIRSDLREMAAMGWLRLATSHAGTQVQPLGIPFDTVASIGIDVGVIESQEAQAAPPPPAPEPIEPEPSELEEQEPEEEPVWKRRPRNWTRVKKEEVVRLWNENKPASFHPITVETLSNDRCQVVARLMDGAGGYKRFVQMLPAVLKHWDADPFWGSPAKGPFGWDSIFGSVRDRKQHLMKAIDSVTSACQGSKPDKMALRFEPLGDQWIDQRGDLTDARRIELAVDLVLAGKAPAKALSELPGWSPSHPANDKLPQPA